MVKNGTPDIVNTSCFLYGQPPVDIPMAPEQIFERKAPINPDGNNIFTCKITYREKYKDLKMFDMNDTNVCHTIGICRWIIIDEGFCMLDVKGECVMFKWDDETSYSFTKIEN